MANMNDLKKFVGRISDEKLGMKTLEYADFRQQNRDKVIADLRKKYDMTDERIEISMAFMDYKEKIISKSEFEVIKENYKHLLS